MGIGVWDYFYIIYFLVLFLGIVNIISKSDELKLYVYI